MLDVTFERFVYSDLISSEQIKDGCWTMFLLCVIVRVL